jgi:SPP1 gp7 family putative phage head morphogenesis protein
LFSGELRVVRAELQGVRSALAAIEPLIADLDVRRPQVLIEAAIAEITGDEAEALAVQLGTSGAALTQVEGALRLTTRVPATETFTTLSSLAAQAGAQNATVMLGAYGAQTTALSTIAPLAAAARATNASARLAAHGTDFAMKAERVIIDGIVRGRGFAPTARELRRETGILRHEAERIVRTESVAAADEARRDTYKASGVEYVQHMATMDARLCGYCASRAGRVYKIGEYEVPLHPNCRCFLAPWREEWQEDDLTDDAWAREHREKSIARASGPPRSGAAPSERWRGLEDAPKPYWSP